jgi:hypothetical protein
MWFSIIYWIGVIVCYVLIRYLRNENFNNNWGWVIIGTICSLGSWAMLLLILFVVGIVYLSAYIDSEPPKWL